MALGFVFEEGDVVDADREEGAEPGGLAGEQVGDRERDVGEDRYVIDCPISYLGGMGRRRKRGRGRYRNCRPARQARR